MTYLLSKNKSFTYKGELILEAFRVDVSGMDLTSERMFAAFAFAEYAPFEMPEGYFAVDQKTDCSMTDSARLFSENVKSEVSVTKFYCAKNENKTLLYEFCKAVACDFGEPSLLGRYVTGEGENKISLSVCSGKLASKTLCSKAYINCSDAQTVLEKASVSATGAAVSLAVPSGADRSYFVAASEVSTVAADSPKSTYSRDFSADATVCALAKSDMRKAAILSLSSKSVGVARELQSVVVANGGGFAPFGKEEAVPYKNLRFSVSDNLLSFGANDEYDALYNAVVCLEQAVFEGAGLEGTKLFASGDTADFFATAEIDADFHDLDAAAVVGKVAREATGFSKSATLYLVHLDRDADKTPDAKAFGELIKNVDKSLSDGTVYAATTVKEGGLATAAILGALAAGKGVYFKSFSADFFNPVLGDVIVLADKKPSFCNAVKLGEIIDNPKIVFGDDDMSTDIAKAALKIGWAKCFSRPVSGGDLIRTEGYGFSNRASYFGKSTKAKVVIPTFGTTKADLELIEGFAAAKGKPELINLSATDKSGMNASLKEFAKRLSAAQILAFSSDKLTALLLNERIRDALSAMLDAGGLVLGVDGGFAALVKSGLLPYGKPTLPKYNSVKILPNASGNLTDRLVKVKIAGNLSPWFNLEAVGDIFDAVVSTSTGRVAIDADDYEALASDGHIATQFADANGMAVGDYPANPTGSFNAVEGLTNSDGRILGRVCRIPLRIEGAEICSETKLYEAGVKYFKL